PAAIAPAHRPGRRVTVGAPLLRIDIRQIDEADFRSLASVEDVGRHVRRAYEDDIRLHVVEHPMRPPRKAAVAEKLDAERAAGDEAAQAKQPRAPTVEPGEAGVLAQRADGLDVAP